MQQKTFTDSPLIVHLLYHLDFGGLETLVVDCVNKIPPDKYRHAIVCLTDFTDFAKKITQPNVQIFALNKPPGLGLSIHFKLWKLLKKLRPAILHTYNTAAIEYSFTAKLAGVPICVHAEHGRDMSDVNGTNKKHIFLKRHLQIFIDRYVSVSTDLHNWLLDTVKIPSEKQCVIINGVDTDKFAPHRTEQSTVLPWPGEHFVIGTVGQIRDIKNHRGLIEAFHVLLQKLHESPHYRDQLRLCIIGEGRLLRSLKQQVVDAGISELVWLPGARSDVAQIMSTFSVFTLPSFAEGTPIALLEAMATGLPIVASEVGGIPEVIKDQVQGSLVPVNDPQALADAFLRYLQQPELASFHAAEARKRIEEKYSLTSMISQYQHLYDELCHEKLH
ncbi:TIGR03088 family PEP-CTERM/XrtA system glycosyltransferase [Undibacterium sp. SXout20W]|uniref:TIGR03088 family PEP-CTERM/XrtA system glycosyltransferase n=1 Tax=Undibacterium sp. SXout20W TaxID=3413051 RepID=UPI003BF444D8